MAEFVLFLVQFKDIFIDLEKEFPQNIEKNSILLGQGGFGKVIIIY